MELFGLVCSCYTAIKTVLNPVSSIRNNMTEVPEPNFIRKHPLLERDLLCKQADSKLRMTMPATWAASAASTEVSDPICNSTQDRSILTDLRRRWENQNAWLTCSNITTAEIRRPIRDHMINTTYRHSTLERDAQYSVRKQSDAGPRKRQK